MLFVSRCAWYQGENHVAVGPQRQDRPQEASARQCVCGGAQRGDSAYYAHERHQARQTRPSPRNHVNSSSARNINKSGLFYALKLESFIYELVTNI